MRCVERPRAVDANHQSWLAFSGFYTRASVPSTPTRIAGSICPERRNGQKMGDRAFTDVDDAQEASPTALASLVELYVQSRSAASGWRREASRWWLLCDCQVQRRRVRVPIRGRNMASQVLLGRLHRRDGMRRLMLRFRELLDVVLQRVEHAP